MYLKRQHGTNDFLCIWAVHMPMSIGSEVVVTRFNMQRKERMNTMTGIIAILQNKSIQVSSAIASIVYNLLQNHI